MTPWAPIAIAVAVVGLTAVVVWRRSHDIALAAAAALLVVALALVAFGTIATAAYFWAAFPLLGSALSLLVSWLRRRHDRT